MAQVHLCHVRQHKTNNARTHPAEQGSDHDLAAHSDSEEAIDQHSAYERGLVHEAQAVRTVDQSQRKEEDREDNFHLRGPRASGSRSSPKAAVVHRGAQH